MRWISCLAVGVALSVPAIVSAQQVAVSGWVDNVDLAKSTITIRTLGNPRTIQVAPNAVVQLNGVAVRLDQLPRNSSISIVTEKASNGVLRATQLSARASGVQSSAAVQPGSLVRGTLVGMNIPNNTITVRTNSGDYPIALGTAPIVMNGVRASTRNLRVGQMIQVERTLPTTASSEYVTQVVRILPSVRTGTSRGSAAVKSRTAGSRTKYRTRSSSSRSKSGKNKRANSRSKRQVLATTVWKGQRFTPVIGMDLAPTTDVVTGGTTVVAPVATGVVTSTVSPGTAVVVPGAVATPGTVTVPGAVVVPEGIVAPGTVIVPGAVVATPGTAVLPSTAPVTATTPGTTGTVGTAPQTTPTNARNQAAGTATGGAGFVDQGTALGGPANTVPAGVPNARAQSLSTPGAVAPGVADPRFQAPGAAGVAPPGVVTPANPTQVTPGAVVPGFTDPRFQGIATPGSVLPGTAPVPTGVPNARFQSPLTPGFIGPILPGPTVPGTLLRPGVLRQPILRPVVPESAPATGGATGQ